MVASLLKCNQIKYLGIKKRKRREKNSTSRPSWVYHGIARIASIFFFILFCKFKTLYVIIFLKLQRAGGNPQIKKIET